MLFWVGDFYCPAFLVTEPSFCLLWTCSGFPLVYFPVTVFFSSDGFFYIFLSLLTFSLRSSILLPSSGSIFITVTVNFGKWRISVLFSSFSEVLFCFFIWKVLILFCFALFLSFYFASLLTLFLRVRYISYIPLSWNSGLLYRVTFEVQRRNPPWSLEPGAPGVPTPIVVVPWPLYECRCAGMWGWPRGGAPLPGQQGKRVVWGLYSGKAVSGTRCWINWCSGTCQQQAR